MTRILDSLLHMLYLAVMLMLCCTAIGAFWMAVATWAVRP